MNKYVLDIQKQLQAAGFYRNDLDGLIGKQTVAAFNSAILALQGLNDDPTVPAGNFRLSERSLKALATTHADMQRVIKRAIQISPVDFSIIEGLRTKEKQAEYVRKGASQTMKSNHLTGNAVDIVPYVGGKLDWDNWDNIFAMTAAVQKAAEELNVNIRWGGAWVRINGRAGTPKDWVEDYKTAQRKLGKKAFMDGVHFELN